ncbi:anion transporter [Actinomycetota bacterium]|nr:anion transporter [Actinomycetota bacterium]
MGETSQEKFKFLGIFSTKQIIFLIAGILAAIIIYQLPAFKVGDAEPLSVDGMHTLAFFAMAILWWIGGVFRDFVTAFAMLTCLIIFGVQPLGTVMSAWSGGVIWIMIPAMMIGIAMSKTGLIKRIVLKVMTWFKPTFKGQTLAIMIAGAVLNPMIPVATAKVCILGPLENELAKSLGYDHKSKASAGLYIAGWMTCGVIAMMALTGSVFPVTSVGLMPEGFKEHWTWLNYFLAAAPWGILMLVFTYFVLRFAYAPKNEQPIAREVIIDQHKALGKMSSHEKITIIVVIAALVLWVTESVHGIPSTAVALAVMVVFFALRILDLDDFRGKLAWDAVTFVAASTGLAAVFTAVGFNTWLNASFGAMLSPLFNNVFLLIIVLSIAIAVIRLFFVSVTALLTITVVACSPLAIAAGMNPMVPALIVMFIIQAYNMLYMNGTNIASYASSEELGDYKYIGRYSIAYTVTSIIAMLISAPIWMALGLV